MRELAVIQILIESFLLQQFLMRSLLDDCSMVHDKDPICVSDYRQPVCNNETGPAAHQVIHSFLNLHLSSGIHA